MKKNLIISLLVTLFYIIGIASAINATMTARTAQGAIAWSVALVSFPFVAVPAYWVFGRSKFEGSQARLMSAQENLALQGFTLAGVAGVVSAKSGYTARQKSRRQWPRRRGRTACR